MERNGWRTRFAAEALVGYLMIRQIKLFYAAGPGDVAGTYLAWKGGVDDPSQVSMTYSGQFFDVVRSLGARAHVMSYCKTRAQVGDSDIVVVHRPKHSFGRGAAAYHLSEVLYGLRVVMAAVLFRADFAIITEGTTHWFILPVMRLFGVKVIPAIQCVLWPKYRRPGGVARFVNSLNRRLFRKSALAVMSASQEITAQVNEVAGGRPRPIVEFLPTYRRETFASIGDPPDCESTFNVLFAGRIERNKGVLDLVELAKRFKSEGKTRIHFDVCGAGSALHELREEAERAGIQGNLVCHGYCDRPEIQMMLNRAHAVIVPTRTDFIEGFNQVIVEAVLAGRPVITSSVCPALNYVREAVMEVAPDDIQAYGDAILKLCDDPDEYSRRRAACSRYQPQFYDSTLGWEAALRQIIRASLDHRDPAALELPVQIGTRGQLI